MPDYVYGNDFGDVSRQELDRRALNRQTYFQSLAEQRARLAQAQRNRETEINTMLQQRAMADRQRQAMMRAAADAASQRQGSGAILNATLLEEQGRQRRASQEDATRRAIAAQQALMSIAQAQQQQSRYRDRDEEWAYNQALSMLEQGTPVGRIVDALPEAQRFKPALEAYFDQFSAKERMQNTQNEAMAAMVNEQLDMFAKRLEEDKGLGGAADIEDGIQKLLSNAMDWGKGRITWDPAQGKIVPMRSNLFSGETKQQQPATKRAEQRPSGSGSKTEAIDAYKFVLKQILEDYRNRGLALTPDVVERARLMAEDRVAGGTMNSPRYEGVF